MRWRGLAVLALLPLALLPGCRGDGVPQAAPAPGLVVASFDFAESRLLAEIYAQALEGRGVAVRRELGLGSRELVLPAVRSGLVDVVPEYAGSLLDAVAPGSIDAGDDIDAVVSSLERRLDGWSLDVLSPAAASNQNVVVVHQGLAAEARLRAISDLATVAGGLVLGGPPECPIRPRCGLGLRERYGLEFAGFEPLGDAELVRRALRDGVVDVGILFSTDPALADTSLVVLADDRGLQPPDNVVPLVGAGVSADRDVRLALDGVSRALTTEGLRLLDWRIARNGDDPAAEARGWLIRHGLVRR